MVGKLRLSERTDRNGEKRSRIQVVADTVQFLGSPTKAAGPDGGVAEEPADKPAVEAYRRRTVECQVGERGPPDVAPSTDDLPPGEGQHVENDEEETAG